ncbi:carboxypeptidase-like regulatory domain-containing protein [Blastopirellula sp. JC732]|uniref:Carboxypeptidase-like regulatory domain-containing protein n=1 Tax=Blastopirellula sediminis TaxID=2894196 RepID=A0A9X1MNS2_9BACT|nr:carboxypeptidase-like regulatory domain-containing protein [Blastopirellula sediminis]MCC9606747.1 carboxypeptidase-like regulatory domain-containing protein [Blastopirellula sediminis]MCC9629956.1 carboxypeptidase-like regulatory domain-containing protein [Blastopirellula sediminis]
MYRPSLCCALFCLLLSLPVSLGCGQRGDKQIFAVEGTVTLDGKPLSNATVLFIPGQSRPSGAMTDENGYYELNYTDHQKGARIGLNRVQITTAQGPSETADGQPIAAVPETLPIRYHARSELEFTVSGDQANVANFALTSRK